MGKVDKYLRDAIGRFVSPDNPSGKRPKVASPVQKVKLGPSAVNDLKPVRIKG